MLLDPCQLNIPTSHKPNTGCQRMYQSMYEIRCLGVYELVVCHERSEDLTKVIGLINMRCLALLSVAQLSIVHRHLAEDDV